jgi:hypothetical protein
VRKRRNVRPKNKSRKKNDAVFSLLDGIITNPLIELEVTSGVVVADVLDHLTQELAIVGQQPLLHVVAQQVAEDTA